MKGITVITAVIGIKADCKSCKKTATVQIHNDSELHDFDDYRLQFVCPYCDEINVYNIPIEEFD